MDNQYVPGNPGAGFTPSLRVNALTWFTQAGVIAMLVLGVAGGWWIHPGLGLIAFAYVLRDNLRAVAQIRDLRMQQEYAMYQQLQQIRFEAGRRGGKSFLDYAAMRAAAGGQPENGVADEDGMKCQTPRNGGLGDSGDDPLFT